MATIFDASIMAEPEVNFIGVQQTLLYIGLDNIHDKEIGAFKCYGPNNTPRLYI